LSIALVNLLPAYPLDGGRILRCALLSAMLNSGKYKGDVARAERMASRIAKALSLAIALAFCIAFFALCGKGKMNYGVLTFALFLATGVFSKDCDAVYAKINFSNLSAFERGLEIRRVAVSESTLVKFVFRYLQRGKYLILDVYDGKEKYLGEVRQSELAEFFSSGSGYSKMSEILLKRAENARKIAKMPQKR
jgi:hypothetical protein